MSIYVDNAATTKMSPAAMQAMLPYFDQVYGNPSSLHSVGQRAAELLMLMGDLERLGDHAMNLLESGEELRDRKIELPPEDRRQLRVLTEAVEEIADLALAAFRREDAAALAHWMGLPFQAVDIRERLEHFVCADFQREYLAGRTPLPCARCNPLVKFPALLEVAEAQGAQYVATGHYARVSPGPGGRVFLRKEIGRAHV